MMDEEKVKAEWPYAYAGTLMGQPRVWRIFVDWIGKPIAVGETNIRKMLQKHGLMLYAD